jgi:nucleotide-binding universal stress UspA family protein
MLRSAHVLCPIDCSEFSRRTFDRAASIAALGTGSVTVLHVVPMPAPSAVMPYLGPEGLAPFPYPEIDREKLTAEVEAALGLPRDVGVPVTIAIVEAPSVYREILAQAARLHAEIIVMGTHGRSGVERLLLGSVAEKVLRTSTIPVLTVPAAATPAPVRRIVCAVDFSENSGHGLEYAAALAEAAGAGLTVVHVVEMPPIATDPIVGVVFEPEDYYERLVREGTRHLHDFVEAHVGEPSLVTQIVGKGRAPAEILRTADQEAADVIVLGIQGRNAVDRFVFGSTADRVVRHASCPVLTVRASRPAVRKAAS